MVFDAITVILIIMLLGSGFGVIQGGAVWNGQRILGGFTGLVLLLVLIFHMIGKFGPNGLTLGGGGGGS